MNVYDDQLYGNVEDWDQYRDKRVVSDVKNCLVEDGQLNYNLITTFAA